MNFEFILTFIFCLGLLEFYIKVADRYGFVDIPSIRSVHLKTTPSSSGIVVFITICIVSFFTELNIHENYNMTLLAVFMVFSLGVYDDLNHVRARYKISVIATAAILASWDGLVIANIGTFFGFTIPLLWISIPVTVFVVTGFTNSLNLIDGLDGLAGSISIVIFSSLWFVGYQNYDLLLTGISTLIIPALLAFMFFNWNPAKTFMGDSGSLTLGFLIALLSIQALNYVNPVVILYLAAFPIIDTTIIITRRIKYGRAIFSPDKNHAHHVLLGMFNGNVSKTVIIIVLIQLIYTLLGMTLVKTWPQEVTLPFFLINLVIWYFVLTRNCKNHHKLILERSLERNSQSLSD